MNSQIIELDKDTLKYMLDASGGFDENNEIFKFLLTIFDSSVSENTQNELQNSNVLLFKLRQIKLLGKIWMNYIF